MGKKDFFWKSKLLLAVNVALSIAAFMVFDLGSAAFGFLLGAAVVTSLCTHPDKALWICLPVQLVLLAAIVFGASVWHVYPVFFLLYPVLLYIAKDADRLALIVAYPVGVILPLAAIAMAIGMEKLILWIQVF